MWKFIQTNKTRHSFCNATVIKMFKLVFEVEMLLKAALKAGLGATDSQSSDGNNNFNKVNKPREFTGKLGALNSKGDVHKLSLSLIHISEPTRR